MLPAFFQVFQGPIKEPQGSAFCNKMWNGMISIKGREISLTAKDETSVAINKLAGDWFENKLNKTLADLEEKSKTYRLSEALIELYRLLWTLSATLSPYSDGTREKSPLTTGSGRS